MQETFDFYTLIIIITFLGVLFFLAFFINKKKEFFKSHLQKNKSINLVNSIVIGAGSRAILFEVESQKFLVVSNKNHTSNILPLPDTNKKNKR